MPSSSEPGPAAIRFEKVTRGSVRALSFEVPPGAVCRLSVASEDKKNELAVVLFGLARPQSGRVFLLGEDLYAISDRDRIRLFRRIGVAPESGGLISNLKVWENILLPAWYHRGSTAAQVEARVVRTFRQMDFSEGGVRTLMGRLPDQLTVFERRLAVMLRAMLMEPDIMVYDFLFSGLDRDAAARLLGLTEQFHRDRAGRTSLYLCPDDAFCERIRADATVRVDA
jgi:phospholipid/cholesterol/gamma-HCH transport system ATP-binding protein